MGVGGDDTWGAPVHDEFLLSSADSYQLSFMIEPLNQVVIKNPSCTLFDNYKREALEASLFMF